MSSSLFSPDYSAQTVLLCEDSPEGIFSAIYTAYEKKLSPNYTKIELLPGEDYQLFTEYIPVSCDTEKAKKVKRTIDKRFGGLTSYVIWCGIYSKERDKADIIYHTIARGLSKKYRGELTDFLQDPYIMMLSKIQKNVAKEAHHYKGFIRFAQLDNGILFSKINPKNYILPLVVSHFSDRFSEEDFVIYDENHHVCLFHERTKESYLYLPEKEEELHWQKIEERLSKEELEVRGLFKTFHQSIAIEYRKNLKLQQNLLPLRFRGNMIDFL